MTLGELIRSRGLEAGTRSRPFLRFGSWECTFGEFYEEAMCWGQWFCHMRATAGCPRPFHVGLLLDNIPDYVFALGGAWLAGAAAIGVNHTKRGEHLAHDINHTDCAILVTETKYLPLLEEIWSLCGVPDTGLALSHKWDSGEQEGPSLRLTRSRLPVRDASRELSNFRGWGDPLGTSREDDLTMLIFTSGTVTAPKAVCCSHRRLVETAFNMAHNVYRLTDQDSGYVAMPLFHANAIMCGLLPALAAGVPVGLARKFSKSQWLSDIRRYGATYFNYTGKPLAYILSTPRQPDDHVNPLRICFGNEGSSKVVEEFEQRFGCQVIDVFGASEGGLGVTRRPEDPPGSIGFPAFGITVVDEEGREKPPARFDAEGRLLNPSECIGEIVNTLGTGWFEGYYKNDSAVQERTRFGWYWSGDLGYKDERGYLYFVGRTNEWLRVDGENFLARPVEAILQRHPDVVLAAVYAVPDPDGGDQVMAALVLKQGAPFDPARFADFLQEQRDLSPKWVPTYIRIATELPQTASGKVLKNQLKWEKFCPDRCGDPVYWRSARRLEFHPFRPEDYADVARRFQQTGRDSLLLI